MENHQTQSKPTDAEQPSPEGLSSSALLCIVRSAMRNMTAEEKEWPFVAMLAGPSEVIEIIVQKAAKECGHAMNWGYVGGRACVRSEGNRERCRGALYSAIPQSDLTQEDMHAHLLHNDQALAREGRRRE